MTCEDMDSCRGWLFCFRDAWLVPPKYIGIIECPEYMWCYIKRERDEP